MSLRRRYTATARALHWAMAAIIIVAWAIGYYANTLVYGVDAGKGATITLHKSIATLTLFLVVIRIVWRIFHRPPELSGMGALMKKAAHAGHFLLYVAMLTLPLSGWAYSSAAGYEIPVAGLFHIPQLLGKDPALEEFFKSIHFFLAWTILVLVAGHIGFALKHHFLDRDGIMHSMLPTWPGSTGR
ncbi:cytochrome b [Telmatospirillum siberiense]|uniref:Cytochrome B n=1 Tax=Telmatospirillum siberiense TaxID=382514 RepID=A0A2N3Q1C7_9PROT|nr:cytochrome b [Telmatospirillum siberiense]PKU26459.1 cytochrome B [Telmatospirillum siberiense]